MNFLGGSRVHTFPSGGVADEPNRSRREKVTPVCTTRAVRHENDRVTLPEQHSGVRIPGERVTLHLWVHRGIYSPHRKIAVTTPRKSRNVPRLVDLRSPQLMVYRFANVQEVVSSAVRLEFIVLAAHDTCARQYS